MSPSNGVCIRGLKPIRLDKLAIMRTGGCLGSRFKRVCSNVGNSRPDSGVHLSLTRGQAVRIRIVNRIRGPNACTVSSFTAVFGTLCRTNNIGRVNALHRIGIFHDSGPITACSICSFVLGNGDSANVHLRSGSIIIMSTCGGLMDIANGMGHPVCCRVLSNRSITRLLGCTNKFSNGTCGRSMHLVHGKGQRHRVCALSAGRRSGFAITGNSSVSISSVVSAFTGVIRIGKTICHPNVFRVNKHVAAIGRLVRDTNKLGSRTFLGHTVLGHHGPGGAVRGVTVGLRQLVSKATSSIPLHGGSILLMPDVFSVRRIRAIAVFNRITFPNACRCMSGVSVRSFVIDTNKLGRTTSATGISITHHVGGSRTASTTSAVSCICSFTVDSNLIIRKAPGFALGPFSRICIHGDPNCRRRRGMAIRNRILFKNACTLRGGGRHLDRLITGTKKLAPRTGVGKTHLRHVVARRRGVHLRSAVRTTVRVTRGGGSSISVHHDVVGRAICPINVRLSETLGGPNSSTSVALHSNSQLVVPRFSGAIGIDKRIVCTGAVTCGGKGQLGRCIGRTNKCGRGTDGSGICVICVGKAISGTGH